MHQRLQLPRDESVIDEEVFLHAEPCISAFEVPRAVVLYPMPKDQVLCPRWRANRIRLHKLHAFQRTSQRGG
jgi:hypothetical protein